MPYFDTGTGRLHYEYEGDAALPVLVLSNSLGTTLDMWLPQFETFKEHFRVLRYDTRGHGHVQRILYAQLRHAAVWRDKHRVCIFVV